MQAVPGPALAHDAPGLGNVEHSFTDSQHWIMTIKKTILFISKHFKMLP